MVNNKQANNQTETTMFARKIPVIYASLKILCKTAACSPFFGKTSTDIFAEVFLGTRKTVCKICKGETLKLPKFRSLTTRSYGIQDSRSSTFAFPRFRNDDDDDDGNGCDCGRENTSSH